jgi:hypothetical protein
MPRLARTHFDVVMGLRPRHEARIREHIARLPPDSPPLTVKDGIGKAESRYLMDYVVDMARGKLSRDGLPVSRMSEGEILSYVPRDVLEPFWSTLNQEYIAALNFTLYGRKAFHISPGLVSHLAETELNVDTELLRLPYRSCMLVFDDPVSESAFYATFGVEPPRRAPITVYAHEVETSDGPMIAMLVTHGDDVAMHHSAVRQLLVKPGTKVEDVLRTDWRTINGPITPREGIDSSDESRFYGPGLRFFRTVLNAFLYLGSSNPEVRGPLTREPVNLNPGLSAKARRRLGTAVAGTALPYIEVGGSVPLFSGPTGGDGLALEHQVKVRGYWKSQHHGPRGTLRKLIRIEPHWRGPEAAEVIERAYYVR